MTDIAHNIIMYQCKGFLKFTGPSDGLTTPHTQQRNVEEFSLWATMGWCFSDFNCWVPTYKNLLQFLDLFIRCIDSSVIVPKVIKIHSWFTVLLQITAVDRFITPLSNNKRVYSLSEKLRCALCKWLVYKKMLTTIPYITTFHFCY